MVMIALCSSLIGAVLGTRFRIHALFPAAVLGLMIVAAVAAFKGTALSSAIAAAVVFGGALQVGYLGGLFTRFCMAGTRLASYRSLRSTAARG
jgi:ABC-type amino acid transport system permease subunit